MTAAEPLRYAIDASGASMRVYAPGVTEENHERVVEAVTAVLFSATSNAPHMTARDAVDDLLADGARETTDDLIADAIIGVTGTVQPEAQPEVAPHDLLTIPEAVEYTRLSRDTLRRAVDAEELRRFGTSRRVLFLRSDLLAWLEAPKARVDRSPVDTRSHAAEGVNLGW